MSELYPWQRLREKFIAGEPIDDSEEILLEVPDMLDTVYELSTRVAELEAELERIREGAA